MAGSEREKLKKAIWQFVIDHSKPHGTGFTCYFGYSDRSNLFWRIYARADGNYKRIDEEEFMEKLNKEQVTFWVERRLRLRQERKMNGLRKRSLCLWLLVHKLRQTANFIINTFGVDDTLQTPTDTTRS